MTSARHGGLNLIGEPGMFARYTDRARRAVVLADQAASVLGHDTVDTGHLLIGLAAEDGGVAHVALGQLGVTLKAADEAVRRRRPAGDADPKAHRAFTPRLKKALELALREALQLGCTYVATEHLLLGLIREGEDTGALALADCGMAEGDAGFLADVRAKVLELLRGYAEAEKREAGPLSRHVSVRFPAALAEAAARIAEAEGMDASAWIRREVDREVGRRAGRCHACGQAVPEAQA